MLEEHTPHICAHSHLHTTSTRTQHPCTYHIHPHTTSMHTLHPRTHYIHAHTTSTHTPHPCTHHIHAHPTSMHTQHLCTSTHTWVVSFPKVSQVWSPWCLSQSQKHQEICIFIIWTCSSNSELSYLNWLCELPLIIGLRSWTLFVHRRGKDNWSPTAILTWKIQWFQDPMALTMSLSKTVKTVILLSKIKERHFKHKYYKKNI